MRHPRSDYDSIQPWPIKRPHIVKNLATGQIITLEGEDIPQGFEQIILDDEPVFLLRAQDVAAIPAMEAWCEAASANGAALDLIDAVHRHIELVRQWQTNQKVKTPDAPVEVLR